MSTWEAILLAIVEGLTEYLPVSSTGHLSMTREILGITDAFSETYIIAVQFGAILSVVALYPRKFFRFDIPFYSKLLTGFMPAAILGYLFDDYLEQLLGMPWVIPFTLVSVGIFLLFTDRIFGEQPDDTVQDISYKQAFMAGLSQCAAMVPGVSRSAASIVGGMAAGMNRTTAATYSFFLAVPTLSAAGIYKMYKNKDLIMSQEISHLLIGNAVAFVVAWLAMRGFVQYLRKHGFAAFGWYRIAAGIAFAAFLYGRG